MFTTSPRNAIETIKTAYASNMPIMLWGSPGVGKSDSIRQAATELGIEVIDIRLSQMDPVDLKGLPTIKDNQTIFATPDFLPKDPNWKGIIFFDEITSAPTMVQAAAYQLILDRKYGEYELPAGALPIGASNLETDRGVVNRMPSPLANRFGGHFKVEPNLDEWIDWAAQNGIQPQIIAYLKFKPDNLYSFDPVKGDKAFATPRSWSYASKWIHGAGSITKALPQLQACVGEGVALDLKAFDSVWSRLPNLDDILAGKQVTFDHSDPALCYAIAAALGHRAEKKNVQHAIGFLSDMSPEYGAMGIKYMLSKTPALMVEKSVRDWAAKNKDLFIR